MRSEQYGGSSIGRSVAIGAAGLITAFGLISGCSSFYTVDAGETAVLTTNGAVVDTVGPGLHFKTPIFQSANIISNQDHTVTYKNLELHTKDQQPVNVNVSVTYQINDPATLYSKFQSQENLESRIINVQVPTVAGVVIGQYDAAGVVDQAGALNVALTTAIRAAITEAPITIKSAQIEGKAFSPEYTNAIQSQKTAEVQVLQANAEKAKRITAADAAAYEVRAQADAAAHAIEVRGLAEAKALDARGKALAASTNLVQLNAVEKWNGTLPTTMVPGNTVPFVNVGAKQ